jgi:hypothetical protein
MTVQRSWVTPITAGAFLLSAVTGVLMFFHLESPLNKTAHEWLSWVLVTGAVLHATANFKALRNHLISRRGQWLVGAFVLLLAASFVPVGRGQGGGPPFRVPIEALANAPVSALAAVAKVSPEEMMRRLAAANVRVDSANQSLTDVVKGNPRRQLEVLSSVLGAGAPRR